MILWCYIPEKGISLLSILIFLGLIFSPIFLPLQEIWADTTSTSVTVSVSGPVCGNDIKETGESCDGSDLNSQTCVGLGYAGGGTLICNANCTFNTSSCSSGGGGGGGGGYVPLVTTKVIIKGIAYPLSDVTIIKDGSVATTTIADSQANFNVEITNITAGTWTFGIWAEDKQGNKSITFSFTTSVTSGMTTTISGIFLPPTIDLSKTAVKKGETLNILGQTAPQSDISIFINSEEEIIKKTTAQADGTWFYGLDTTFFEEGSHSTRSKATSSDGLLSTFSKTLAFSVGKGGVERTTTEKSDINADKRVNLVDFSILLYNWGVPKNLSADFNNDNKVNLVDFSIMLYWWTG